MPDGLAPPGMIFGPGNNLLLLLTNPMLTSLPASRTT
jgi:hypothetical protein